MLIETEWDAMVMETAMQCYDKQRKITNKPTSTSFFGDGHISTHADHTHGQCAGRISQCWPARAGALCDSSNFGLLGEILGESSPKCEIPCPRCR